jgi:predicted Zn-dependent protease
MHMLRFTSIVAVLVLAGCVTASQLQQASIQEFEKMREELTVSENVKDRAYVQCIADSIVAQLDEPYASINWDLELFEEDELNAFAMPGGQIGVFTGIFKAAQNQDQLAAVIGHEVAHVTRGHSLKRANQQQAATVGILAGVIVSEAVRNNAGLIVLGAQLGLMLPYGRSQESEADIAGLDFLARAGFRPEASVELWRNMAEASPSSMPAFMSTHPSSDARIHDLQEQISVVTPMYQQARAQGRKPNCSR